jgi:Kef-type K+ transport system membrane component KefB
MKETLLSTDDTPAPKKADAPQGIGMAVAYDWGLTVQLFVTPLFNLYFGLSANAKSLNLNPTLVNVLLFVVLWPMAFVIALYGNAVRSGREWARKMQVIANILLSVGGIFSVISLVQGIKSGDYWPVVPTFLLLVISPIIAWRLSRPVTARWYKTVTVQEARKRHGGIWVFFIALWAIVGGILQALATIK